MVLRTRCYGCSREPVAAGMMLTWSVGGAEKVLFSVLMARLAAAFTDRDPF